MNRRFPDAQGWYVFVLNDSGQRLLYADLDGRTSGIALTSMDGSALRVVELSGGAARLIRAGGSTTLFSSLVWSLDSKRIGYQRQDYAPPGERQVVRDSAQLEKNYRYSYESVLRMATTCFPSLEAEMLLSSVSIGSTVFVKGRGELDEFRCLYNRARNAY